MTLGTTINQQSGLGNYSVHASRPAQSGFKHVLARGVRDMRKVEMLGHVPLLLYPSIRHEINTFQHLV